MWTLEYLRVFQRHLIRNIIFLKFAIRSLRVAACRAWLPLGFGTRRGDTYFHTWWPLVRSQVRLVCASCRHIVRSLSKKSTMVSPSRSENRPDDRTVRASGKDRQQRAHFTLFRVSKENEGRGRARGVLIRQRTMSRELQPEVCQERT